MNQEQEVRSTDPIATAIRAQIAAAVDERIARGLAYAVACGSCSYDDDALLNASVAADSVVNEIVGALVSYIAHGFYSRTPSSGAGPTDDGDALAVVCHAARQRAVEALPIVPSMAA